MVTPHSTCTTPNCSEAGKPLGQHKVYSGSLFTWRRGVLPVIVVTLYCRGAFVKIYTMPSTHTELQHTIGCKTTYRPNYHVQNAGAADAKRQYPLELPSYMECAEHCYVERDLVEVFRAQMAFSQYAFL